MKRLTPELCLELADLARQGLLVSLTITQAQPGKKGAKFTVEYRVSEHSYARTENFHNRHRLANTLTDLATLLSEKKIANLYLRLFDPLTSHFELTLTATAAKEEPADASDE